MKKRISLLLMLSMLVALLSGCGSKNTIKVYVMEADKLFNDAILEYNHNYPDEKVKVETFDNYQEMSERLNKELAEGKGPDVILYNSLFNDVDPYQLAASGKFLPLDEQVAGLSEDTYYKQILDAGKVNGQQFYLPLSWNVLQVYSAPEKITGENLYDSFIAEAAEIQGNESLALNNYMFFREDWMNFFMEITGSQLFDAATGELTEQKELVKETADFLKDTLYAMYDQNMSILEKYNRSFENSLASISYMMENNSLLVCPRLFETLYKTYHEIDATLSLFERLDGEGITAQVIQYGAINANTKNPESAWKFLQSIIEIEPTVSFRRGDFKECYFAPIKIAFYEGDVERVTKFQGPGIGQGKVGPLGAKLGQQMLEIPSRVTKAVIPNYTSYGIMVKECMAPYLNGVSDFDSCYDKLLQRTKEYLGK